MALLITLTCFILLVDAGLVLYILAHIGWMVGKGVLSALS
jgi:hypothetical protein